MAFFASGLAEAFLASTLAGVLAFVDEEVFVVVAFVVAAFLAGLAELFVEAFSFTTGFLAVTGFAFAAGAAFAALVTAGLAGLPVLDSGLF